MELSCECGGTPAVKEVRQYDSTRGEWECPYISYRVECSCGRAGMCADTPKMAAWFWKAKSMPVTVSKH